MTLLLYDGFAFLFLFFIIIDIHGFASLSWKDGSEVFFYYMGDLPL